MPATNLPLVLYVAPAQQAAEFRKRCHPIKDKVAPAALAHFGSEPIHTSFESVLKYMESGAITWAAFDWDAIADQFGASVLLNELKWLISKGACDKTKSYIVDARESIAKPKVFESLGIDVVNDPIQIGGPFSHLLTLSELSIEEMAEENEVFAGIQPPDHSHNPDRFSERESSTPSHIKKNTIDPFAQYEDMDEEDIPVADDNEDPFSHYGNSTMSFAPGMNMTEEANDAEDKETSVPMGLESDPFADMMGNDDDSDSDFDELDIFDELDNDLGGGEDDLGNGFDADGNIDDLFMAIDDDLIIDDDPIGGSSTPLSDTADDPFADMFSDPETPAQKPETGAASSTADPFADFDDPMDPFADPSPLPLTPEVEPSDPFADMFGDPAPVNKTDSESNQRGDNPPTVDEFLGGVGGAMNGSSLTGDIVLPEINLDDPFANGNAGNSNTVDPFANMEETFPDYRDMDAEPEYMEADDFDDGGEFDDPFADVPIDGASAAGIMPAGAGAAPGAGRDDQTALRAEVISPQGGELTLEDIFEQFGDRLPINDYNKLMSMLSPQWSYEGEGADKIGLAGANKAPKGKLRGKGAIKKTYSQVPEETLADSLYIPEMEEVNGHYSPPDDCKTIVVNSQKGGSGKSLTADTRILCLDTETGRIIRKTMGQVRVGDFVFSRSGKAVRVLEVHPQPEKMDVYRISLRDGRTIECSGDHLWNVLRRGSHRLRDHHRTVMTTEQMMEQSITKNGGRGKHEYRWKIPVPEALEFPRISLPIDPYLLGLLIGDGCLTREVPEITANDDETVERIREIAENAGWECHQTSSGSWAITSNRNSAGEDYRHGLRELLDALGLWGCRTESKFIPSPYLYASISQRRALLQGLMDSDGSATRGRFSFTTINRKLKDQFMELVRSLGYICSSSLDKRSEKYITGECWSVRIQSNDVENIFRLSRKKDSYYEYKSKQTPAKTLPEKGTISICDSDGTVVDQAENIEDAEKTAQALPSDKRPLGTDDAPVDPYLLGVLLSRRKMHRNGTIRITVPDQHAVLRIIKALPENTEPTPDKRLGTFIMQTHTESGRKRKTETPLHVLLDEIGAFSDDGDEATGGRLTIPESYMNGSPALRLAILQGLMDSAGRFSASSCLPRVQLSSSPFVSEQVRCLAESLGYETETALNAHEKGSLVFKTDDTSLFFAPSQKEKMHNFVDTAYGTKTNSWMGNDDRYISITGIEKTGKKSDMVCLYVDDEEHLFVAGDYIATHNTTVSVGIATQLNWYFNKSLMLSMDTNFQSRILILSLNEFDDIPIHNIGYEGFQMENDYDGKNIAELLRRIDDTNGDPSWDDIMHCFVCNSRNRVFYLPSLVTREILEEGIVLTTDDYRRILEVCSRFFQFIIIDTPDVFYHEKNDLMNFAYSIADIITMVIEPDDRSITHLYHFLNGLEVDTGRVPLNPAKCLLTVNKYVTEGNPYIAYPEEQLPYESITSGTAKYFSRFACIPYTRPMGSGSIINGTDPKVKEAFGDLADTILEMISENDRAADKKKKKR